MAPLYVETLIRAPIDEVWQRTQDPSQHQRWDLRFSTISYLPRTDDGTQRFEYSTRLGFGLAITGWGETAGEHLHDGSRTSALRFGSDEWWSLIREGAGYWKYVPTPEGTRFITGYDYQVRWGIIGRVVDRILFRPLIGWATAWSFDRLRRWIEEGKDPETAARTMLIHSLAVLAVSWIWCWHGLVPKLLTFHPDEIRMVTDAGVRYDAARQGIMVAGFLEFLFGLLFPYFARQRWPWLLTIVLMIIALVGVMTTSPAYLVAPFNPVTTNLAMIVLATVGLLTREDFPSAKRCLRHPMRAAE